MSKFKIGDKVKVINGYKWLKQDRVGIVTQVVFEMGACMVAIDNDSNNHYEYRYEFADSSAQVTQTVNAPAEKSKFKVGDFVSSNGHKDEVMGIDGVNNVLLKSGRIVQDICLAAWTEPPPPQFNWSQICDDYDTKYGLY